MSDKKSLVNRTQEQVMIYDLYGNSNEQQNLKKLMCDIAMNQNSASILPSNFTYIENGKVKH